ncbi:MAG TPA: hypothetical protein VI758_01120, partial [Bacteroidota bacterium]
CAVFENLGLSGPQPKYSLEIRSSESGYVAGIDPLELGLASITLGAGREKIDDVIDPKAGIKLIRKVGDKVESGDTVAVFYTDRQKVLESARARIAGAFRYAPQEPARIPLVLDVVDKNGLREWKS